MNAKDVKDRLVERYCLADGWVTMLEVTPPTTSRRFDLLAIMSWGSRGQDVHGIEVKVSRGDWLSELHDPSKADPLVRLCTKWWIAAPPGIVEVKELPQSWGLLVIHPKKIVAAKQAHQLTPDPWNEPMWRCMMLRLATRMPATNADIADAQAKGFAEGQKAAEAKDQRSVGARTQELEDLKEVIKKAEKATGVSLTRWSDYPLLGKAVQVLNSSGITNLIERIERDANHAQHAADSLKLALKDLQTLQVKEVA